MIRPVRADGRIDAGGAFTPIHRPRVVERIATAAMQRVVLIVAPAGYGKSVALRQYLEDAREPFVRYDLQAESANLLGFVRGFADLLGEIAPDARKTVSGAYEKSRASRTPGLDLAMWMHAHIKTFNGVVAIDDLHLAENDPQISKFLVSLIERTKGRARWVIASRSTLDLPVGTWLAYGEMDLTVDEQDLRFTMDEARQTAKASRVGVRDEELTEILAMTEGWPTALSFALRSSTRSVDLRNIAATTREMIYRYLAEQVFHSLTEDERDFLHFASYLPEIDVDVLRCAGYDKGKAIVESLRDRVAFIYPDRPGVYRCHDMFRDFLQHQLELEGDAAVEEVRLRVAAALEAAGRTASALILFAQASATAEVSRILAAHGFDLMEQAHGDAVQHAVDSLPQDVRATDPLVLGLRALQESDAGRLERAESLFDRAIAKTTNPELAAKLAIRLAIVLFNQGKDAVPLLEPLMNADAVAPSIYVELLSLLACAHALRGAPEAASMCMVQSQAAIRAVDSDVTRAKVLQRLGMAAYYSGQMGLAKELGCRAADLSIELGLFSLASRAYSMLGNIWAQHDDDLPRLLWYGQHGANAAAKGGDALGLQNALLQLIHGEARRGNVERLKSLEQQLASNTASDLRHVVIVPSRALSTAWAGKFDEAHRLLSGVCDKMAYAPGRLEAKAFCALYFMADGQRDQALVFTNEVTRLLDEMTETDEYARRSAEMSRILCGLVETMAGRGTIAARVLQRKPLSSSTSVEAFRTAVTGLIQWIRGNGSREGLHADFEHLRTLGYGGYCRLLEAVAERWAAQAQPTETVLTPAEASVLRALAEGKAPKDIAIENGRSVYTIQAHIQNIITKLGCSGRHEALVIARKRGLIA